jgi:hypothetical protein
LPTLPEDQKDEPWYYTIEYGYAWITGYRPYEFWSNTTECFDRMTNYTYHEKPALADYLGNDDNSDYDKSERTLLLVRNLSEHMWFCNDAWQSANYFWYFREREFDSFSHFLLSALQNVFGSVFSVNNVYNSMVENIEANDTIGVQYDTARLVRLLTIFEPIELYNDDLIYSPSDNDDDSNDPDVNGGREVLTPGFRRLERTKTGHLAHPDLGPFMRMLESWPEPDF